MTTSQSDPGARLLSAVSRLNRWATRHADLQIPPAQARLLSLIDSIGPARIGELAEADHCSQPTMSTQVQRVESAGWASRTDDPSDRRASMIELTDEGRDVLNEVRAARHRAVADVFATLTPAETAAVDQATTVIEKFVARSESTK
ncbi:MarR family winged helix-turn-helix transcriptional regulator [Leekyejoonella antrihumi]|uniref:MarR family transcriptional regulator n=1 Tax=Leekyejoonella antrihumi TaxID=1660198 RepID=A0A563E6J7_9MICO|nr:MarR family transcriptional regulator [Leekyejoonella antrihumi]TWP37883.1 MarR family transcriptional regulator [Leekyejoonella antrihumi]